MKIKKFNERTEYNFPISEQKLREIDKLKTKVEEFDQFFLPVLGDYFRIHPELQVNHEYDDFEDVDLHIIDYNLLNNPDYKFRFVYKTDDYKEDEYNETTLTNKDFEDLLEYLQNPELYKSVKKYNL